MNIKFSNHIHSILCCTTWCFHIKLLDFLWWDSSSVPWIGLLAYFFSHDWNFFFFDRIRDIDCIWHTVQHYKDYCAQSVKVFVLLVVKKKLFIFTGKHINSYINNLTACIQKKQFNFCEICLALVVCTHSQTVFILLRESLHLLVEFCTS